MIPGIEQLLAYCAPQVAPVTMMAIVRVESAGNPWAINVNGPRQLPKQPQSREEAVRWADALIDAGYSVDMGLMQVNSGNLVRMGLNAAQMFDPCTNLAAGAKILADFYDGAARRQGEGQAALRAALSAYNTGNHVNGFRNGYVGKVTAAAYQPVSTPGLEAKRRTRAADNRQTQFEEQPGGALVYWVRLPQR